MFLTLGIVSWCSVMRKQLVKSVKKRQQQYIETTRQANSAVSLDTLFEQMKQGEMKDLNIIIKADVQGSVEALAMSLAKIDVEGVNVRIISHWCWCD